MAEEEAEAAVLGQWQMDSYQAMETKYGNAANFFAAHIKKKYGVVSVDEKNGGINAKCRALMVFW